MNWYSHMMRSYEVARAENQRMERREQGNKYGPEFVAQTRLAALNKEKRMIERELERIRKGIHRQPQLGDIVQRKEGHVLTVKSPLKSDTNENDMEYNSAPIEPEYSVEESKLYDTILFFHNNPSALVPILAAHARSDAYLETLERISPRLSVENNKESSQKQKFVPRYLKENFNKHSEKSELLNKYTSLLQRHSPELRRHTLKPSDTPRVKRHNPLLTDSFESPRSAPSVLPPIDTKLDNTDEADRATHSDARDEAKNKSEQVFFSLKVDEIKRTLKLYKMYEKEKNTC